MSSDAAKAVGGNRRLGELLVLLAGVSWGFLGFFVRYLNKADLGALDICGLRSLGAAALLLTGLGVGGHRTRRMLRVRIKDIWCFAGAGLLSITAFNCCYFATLRHTTIGVAVILLYTSPVFVALMSWLFFHESFTRWKFLAMVMMMAGCVLISGVFASGGVGALAPTWLFVGLCSGFCYALYSIFGRLAQERGYSSLTITTWSFCFACIGSSFIVDWHHVIAVFRNHPIVILPWLGLVMVSTILSYSTYTAGLRHLETSIAAVIVAVEPAVATLTGIIAFGEHFTVQSTIGMVLILLAVLVLNRRTRPAEAQSDTAK